MKRSNIKLWLLLFLPFFMGCEKETYTFNDPEGAVFFCSTSSTVYVTEEKEYTEMEISVGASNLSDVDREFVVRTELKGLGVEEAKQGEHYEIPDPVVVIPAGKYTGSVKVLLYPGSLPKGIDIVAYFSLGELSSETGLATYNQAYVLYMSRVCKFTIDDLVGTYVFTSRVFTSPQLTDRTVKIVREEGKDDVVRMISPYLQDDMLINVSFDEFGRHVIEIPKQGLIRVTGYNMVYFQGTGTWDSCVKDKLTFDYILHSENGVINGDLRQEEFIRK